jgi:probable addiction module antidote protein
MMAEVLDPLHAAYLLSNKTELASFLDTLLGKDDLKGFMTALGVLGRVYGMEEIAEKIGMKRTTAYMAFSENGNPSFKHILKMLNVFGVKLVFFQQ